jgi:hypothetical protein
MERNFYIALKLDGLFETIQFTLEAGKGVRGGWKYLKLVYIARRDAASSDSNGNAI